MNKQSIDPKRFLIAVVMMLLLGGCAKQYAFEYESTLVDEDGLAFSDSLFSFKFQPVYNGIVFTIYNNSEESAVLLWDKSYFILPGGNSYKALNIDLLRENNRAANKESYTSLIPSRASLKRFTTPNTNVQSTQLISISEHYDGWLNRGMQTVKIYYEPLFEFGNYWPRSIKTKPGVFAGGKDVRSERRLGRISSLLYRKNNLGLGLVLLHRSTEKEYRFDFKIHRVNVYSVGRDSALRVNKYSKIYTLDVKDGKWREVR